VPENDGYSEMKYSGKKRRLINGDYRFTLFLLVLTSVMLAATFGYRPRSRIFPLIVLIPAVMLLAAQALSHFFQPLAKVLESLSTIGFGEIQRDAASSAGSQPPRKNELTALLSWIIYGIAAFLVGFKIASPLFMFCVSLFYAKKSVMYSVLLSAGVFFFLKGMFEYLLGIALYDGWLMYYL